MNKNEVAMLFLEYNGDVKIEVNRVELHGKGEHNGKELKVHADVEFNELGACFNIYEETYSILGGQGGYTDDINSIRDTFDKYGLKKKTAVQMLLF